jgi:hypothetical protein
MLRSISPKSRVKFGLALFDVRFFSFLTCFCSCLITFLPRMIAHSFCLSFRFVGCFRRRWRFFFHPVTLNGAKNSNVPWEAGDMMSMHLHIPQEVLYRHATVWMVLNQSGQAVQNWLCLLVGDCLFAWILFDQSMCARGLFTSCAGCLDSIHSLPTHCRAHHSDFDGSNSARRVFDALRCVCTFFSRSLPLPEGSPSVRQRFVP